VVLFMDVIRPLRFPPSVLNRAIISHLGLALRSARQAPSPGMGAALRSGRGPDSALRA